MNTSEAARGGQPILLIADDWERLTLARAALEYAGYAVHGTDSPAEGLTWYLRETYEAVILDFDMPLMTSRMMASVMRRFRRDVPLLVIEGADQADDSESLGPLDRAVPRGTSPGALVGDLQRLMGGDARASEAAKP